MGAKKKVEVAPPPTHPPPEKASNVTLRIVTSEGAQFKLSEELFSRYSLKGKALAELSKDGTVRLDEVDGETFGLVLQYLELHSEKEPAKIAVPIRSNQSLKHIMEEADAALVERISQQGDMALLKVMDACLLLELESFRKRLACGAAIKLMGSTVEELRDKYELGEFNGDQEGLRSAMRPFVQYLRNNSMEEEI